MTTLLKLGGSLLTDKAAPETLDEASLERVSDRLVAGRPDRLVIVHGGGSFGHPAARAHGVSRTTGTRDPAAIHEVGRAMGRLNDAVVDAFANVGLQAVGLSARGLATKHDDGAVVVSPGPVRTFLDERMLPVLYGDMVAHASVGCSVLGGDQLVVSLATALDADRIGLCADVPGVLSRDGTVIEQVDRYDEVADLLGEPEGADVTGGIGWKVRALLESDVPGGIFGLAELGTFLDGGLPGTRVGVERA